MWRIMFKIMMYIFSKQVLNQSIFLKFLLSIVWNCGRAPTETCQSVRRKVVMKTGASSQKPSCVSLSWRTPHRHQTARFMGSARWRTLTWQGCILMLMKCFWVAGRRAVWWIQTALQHQSVSSPFQVSGAHFPSQIRICSHLSLTNDTWKGGSACADLLNARMGRLHFIFFLHYSFHRITFYQGKIGPFESEITRSIFRASRACNYSCSNVCLKQQSSHSETIYFGERQFDCLLPTQRWLWWNKN